MPFKSAVSGELSLEASIDCGGAPCDCHSKVSLYTKNGKIEKVEKGCSAS